jgi:hypothetical protein
VKTKTLRPLSWYLSAFIRVHLRFQFFLFIVDAKQRPIDQNNPGRGRDIDLEFDRC